jgi:DNA-binding response OmpR family regulator
MSLEKILVAEDASDIRELIAFTLEMHGYEVITARDGLEALELARKFDPDLVMLDVRMPRMSGYEACRALKADSHTAPAPVVFLSARGQEEEVQAGRAAGAVAYIQKPFSIDDLIERVGKLLQEHPRQTVSDEETLTNKSMPA